MLLMNWRNVHLSVMRSLNLNNTLKYNKKKDTINIKNLALNLFTNLLLHEVLVVSNFVDIILIVTKSVV